MDIPYFLGILEKYGWLGVVTVILGAIIFVLIKFILSKFKDNFSNMSKDLSTTIAESMAKQNNALVNTINTQNERLIDFFIKTNSDEKVAHSTMLEDKMNISGDVTDKIKDLTNYTNADRVSILEFHNSSNNLLGVPFAKFSCTYEWFKPGIVPLMTKLSGLQFSLIGSVVRAILDGNRKYIIYDSIADIKYENPALFYELEQSKVKSIMFFAMYDNKNCMCGLLSIEYHNGKINKDILNYDEIIYDVLRVTSLINLSK